MTVSGEIKELKNFCVKMKGAPPEYILLSPHMRERLLAEQGDLLEIKDIYLGMRLIVSPFAGSHFLELGYNWPEAYT